MTPAQPGWSVTCLISVRAVIEAYPGAPGEKTVEFSPKPESPTEQPTASALGTRTNPRHTTNASTLPLTFMASSAGATLGTGCYQLGGKRYVAAVRAACPLTASQSFGGRFRISSERKLMIAAAICCSEDPFDRSVWICVVSSVARLSKYAVLAG